VQTQGRFQIVISSPEGSRTEVFERTEIVVGRSSSADLVISNTEVSRKHLLIKLENDHVTIVDLGSKNGTFVDGKTIPGHTPVTVKAQHKIRLGLAPDEISIRWDVSELPADSAVSIHSIREEEPPPLEPVKPTNEPRVSMGRAQAQVPVVASRDDLNELNKMRSKLESEIRELQAEVKSRQEERKEFARLHAETRLKLQEVQQEFDRLKSAKESLSSELGREIGELDERSRQLNESYEAASKEHTEKLQRTLKEQVEKAKKKAALMVSEAEMKAKTIKDKAQAEAANIRKTSELDIAEIKLKQMQEVKEVQEHEDSLFRERRETAAREFLGRMRLRIEEAVKAEKLPDAVKVKLISMLEEGLFEHFSPEKIATAPEEMTATGIRIPEEETDGPPPLPQLLRQPFPLMIVSTMAALIVGLAIGRNLSVTQPTSRQLASVPTDIEAESWRKLGGSGEIAAWQKWSGDYLAKTYKLEDRVLSKFHTMESRFLTDLQKSDSNSATRLTRDFSREAEQLLGAQAFRQLIALRRQFLKRNQ